MPNQIKIVRIQSGIATNLVALLVYLLERVQ